MQKYRIAIIVSLVALLLLMGLQIVLTLWPGLACRDGALLALWMLAILDVGFLAGLGRKVYADCDDFCKTSAAKQSSLARSLVDAESAMSEKDARLSESAAEISRLSEAADLGKRQISQLRNEIGSCKSKIKESRQLIEKLRQRAEMSDRLKAALLANIKDELGNPLNSILGYAPFLKSQTLDDSRKMEYLDIIARYSRRFLDTIYDLYYYSKLMVGDVEPVASTFNINAMLENAVSKARQQVAQAGKNVEVRLSQSISSGFICGFEAGYVKIISNLLSNAVKFTSEGVVDVRCSENGSVVRVVVEDTGIGFSLSNRALIFEPFFQADLSLSRKYSGTGLGLAICRSLASLMGGAISAESREGAGSKFSLEIPLFVPSDSEIDVYEKADMILSTGVARRRMLMVTPFDEDFDFVCRFMNNYGIETIRSNSAEESDLLVKQSDSISMTIIDLHSWTLQGLEAAERIFRLKPSMKFAFVSDIALEPQQYETIRPFTDIILRKPFNSLVLSKLLVGLSGAC